MLLDERANVPTDGNILGGYRESYFQHSDYAGDLTKRRVI